MEDNATGSASLPRFLSRRILHEHLRPGLSARAFDNWLLKATRLWGFPQPVRLGARSVAWSDVDVAAWVASRPRGGRFDGKRGPGRAAA
jgi:predicted DNA-binding transcriptional regulator AlpA